MAVVKYVFSMSCCGKYFSKPFATRAFSLATRAFSLITGGFELATREFELITGGFELVTREFELVTREFELVTRGFELVTRVLLFHLFYLLYIYKNPINLSLLKIELNHGTIIQTQFHD